MSHWDSISCRENFRNRLIQKNGEGGGGVTTQVTGKRTKGKTAIGEWILEVS